MYKLKLTKGLSYNGLGVKVTSKEPDVEVKEKETSDALVATGRFALLDVDSADNGGGVSGENMALLEKMNNTQLVAFAGEHDIDIADCKNAGERLAKIKQFIADNGGGVSGEGKLDFGNNE